MLMNILVSEEEVKAIIRTVISEIIDDKISNQQTSIILKDYEKHQIEQCNNNCQGNNRSNNFISNEII